MLGKVTPLPLHPMRPITQGGYCHLLTVWQQVTSHETTATDLVLPTLLRGLGARVSTRHLWQLERATHRAVKKRRWLHKELAEGD